MTSHPICRCTWQHELSKTTYFISAKSDCATLGLKTRYTNHKSWAHTLPAVWVSTVVLRPIAIRTRTTSEWVGDTTAAYATHDVLQKKKIQVISIEKIALQTVGIGKSSRTVIEHKKYAKGELRRGESGGKWKQWALFLLSFKKWRLTKSLRLTFILLLTTESFEKHAFLRYHRLLWTLGMAKIFLWGFSLGLYLHFDSVLEVITSFRHRIAFLKNIPLISLARSRGAQYTLNNNLSSTNTQSARTPWANSLERWACNGFKCRVFFFFHFVHFSMKIP